MTLQREPGKSHEPMRPRLITLDMASDQNLALDTGGTVDWTPDATRLALRQLNKYFDSEGPNILLQGATNSVRLRKGLWRFKVVLETNKSAASDGGIAVAITNLGGTTVHKEWDTLDQEDQIGRTTCELEYVHKVTTPTDVFCIRAVRRDGGFTATVDAAYVGSIQKVANDQEAREE